MSDLRWHLLYFQHVQNGTTFQHFPGCPPVLAFTISALDDVNSLVTVLVHCSPFSFPHPQAPSSRCWLIRHLRENWKNVPLSSGRRNLMPGFIAWPTELSLNVLTQDITSTTVHSSPAYTFLTAVCITPLKGSRVLSLLCSKPSQVSRLASYLSGLLSLLSSLCFAQEGCWRKEGFSSNVPDTSEFFLSLFVPSSCKDLSAISKWLALSHPSSVRSNVLVLVTSTLTILVKRYNPHLYPDAS